MSREVASFLPSVTRLSGVVLTRGFASPPHDGYALVGKGLRRDRKICMAGARAAWEVSTGKGPVETRASASNMSGGHGSCRRLGISQATLARLESGVTREAGG